MDGALGWASNRRQSVSTNPSSDYPWGIPVLKRVDEQALSEHERDGRIPEELGYTNWDWV